MVISEYRLHYLALSVSTYNCLHPAPTLLMSRLVRLSNFRPQNTHFFFYIIRIFSHMTSYSWTLRSHMTSYSWTPRSHMTSYSCDLLLWTPRQPLDPSIPRPPSPALPHASFQHQDGLKFTYYEIDGKLIQSPRRMMWCGEEGMEYRFSASKQTNKQTSPSHLS